MKISDTQVQIENVIIEPESMSQQFIVYGTEAGSGVLFYLDFAELHEKECKIRFKINKQINKYINLLHKQTSKQT